jgi:adenylate cyclase
VDVIRVKGKSEPDRIYALLGDTALASRQDFRDLAEAQSRLLRAYRGQCWQEAEAALDDCRRRAAGLGLSGLFDLYAERIATFRRSPPPADWDGVFEATSK